MHLDGRPISETQQACTLHRAFLYGSVESSCTYKRKIKSHYCELSWESRQCKTLFTGAGKKNNCVSQFHAEFIFKVQALHIAVNFLVLGLLITLQMPWWLRKPLRIAVIFPASIFLPGRHKMLE